MNAVALSEPVDLPSELPLSSFRVNGFRAFRELLVPELGRVNLFVGKNNVGKTTLLEAFHLYATGAVPAALTNLLVSRGEIASGALRRHKIEPEVLSAAVDRIFHVRPNGNVDRRVALGMIADTPELLIDRGWVSFAALGETPRLRFSRRRGGDMSADEERGLQVRTKRFGNHVFTDARLLRLAGSIGTPSSILPSTYVPAFGLSADETGAAWDRIALTDAEDAVRDALQIIAPDVERISLVGDGERGERKIVVRVRARSAPVPLKSMGDGMNRLLSISLSLVNSEGGLLLLDEVENGIHYSVQIDMWRLILDVAERLGVQVFATTHSWDCIRAFAAAASESPRTYGMLHRLERTEEGEIRTVGIGEEDLAIIARQRIEVR